MSDQEWAPPSSSGDGPGGSKPWTGRAPAGAPPTGPAGWGGPPQPYPPGPAPWQLPPVSRTMAVWALVVSLLGACMPLLGSVLAVVLGVEVLRKGRRDGRDHGRGLAIAAIAIAPFTLALSIWLVLLDVTEDDAERSAAEQGRSAEGPSPTGEPPSQVADDGRVDVASLAVGDCFDDPRTGTSDPGDDLVADVAVVRCGSLHRYEVYSLVRLPQAEAFPGTQRLGDRALETCGRRFGEFVGIDYRRSTLRYTTYSPTRRGWNTGGDRDIHCVIRDPEGPVRGTLAGSRR